MSKDYERPSIDNDVDLGYGDEQLLASLPPIDQPTATQMMDKLKKELQSIERRQGPGPSSGGCSCGSSGEDGDQDDSYSPEDDFPWTDEDGDGDDGAAA